MIRFEVGPELSGGIDALVKRFEAVPKYIAKKHLKAVMKRVMKAGVVVLKKNTPRGRGTLNAGTGRRGGGGALRRAATAISRFKGTNKRGTVIGVLGYKYGVQSRKAIWLEHGTKTGIAPRRMVGRTMEVWRGPAAQRLEQELKKALEAAVKEAKAGINPGVGKSGYGPGRRK